VVRILLCILLEFGKFCRFGFLGMRMFLLVGMLFFGILVGLERLRRKRVEGGE